MNRAMMEGKTYDHELSIVRKSHDHNSCTNARRVQDHESGNGGKKCHDHVLGIVTKKAKTKSRERRET